MLSNQLISLREMLKKANLRRTLNFQNKVVANYEMVEEVNGELYHDILLNKLGVVIKDLDTKNAYN